MSSKEYVCRLGDMTITFRERTFSHLSRKEYFASPRMYVHVSDETIAENMFNRKRRPYNVYKTLIHGSLLGQILDLGKLTWSQYAGCGCPCSPGFILPQQTMNIGGRTFSRFDVWVKIDNAPAVNEAKPAREIASV